MRARDVQSDWSSSHASLWLKNLQWLPPAIGSTVPDNFSQKLLFILKIQASGLIKFLLNIYSCPLGMAG